MDIKWEMDLVVQKYTDDNLPSKIVKYDLSDIMEEHLKGENFQDVWKKKKQVKEILRKKQQRLKTWNCYKKKKQNKDYKYLCDICGIAKYDVFGRFLNHQKICREEIYLINKFLHK